MDNDKNNSDQGKPKNDQSLSLEDVSISTMKSELEKADEKEVKEGGWFDFLSKHKKEDASQPVQAVTSNQPVAEATEKKEEAPIVSSEETLPKIASLDQETEKIVNESPVLMGEEGEATPKSDLDGEMNELSKVLAQNKSLDQEEAEKPLDDQTLTKIPDISTVSSVNNEEKEEIAEKSLLEEELDAFKEETEKNSKTMETPANLPIAESFSRPSLSSVLPQKEEEKETSTEEKAPNKLMDVLNKGKEEGAVLEFKGTLADLENKEAKGASDLEEKTASPDDSKLELKKFSLEDEKSSGDNGKVRTVSPFRGDGLSGTIVDSGGENPFSAHIDPREREGNSLLQKVESAINYSASPDFSKQRELGEKSLSEGGTEGKVVDLSGKKEDSAVGASASGKKKMIAIAVGVGGVILVFVILLLIFAGGNTKVTTDNKNVNINTNTNAPPPPKPILNANVAVPETPKIAIQKVIESTESTVVSTPQDVAKKIQEYKDGTPVNKLTQLVFAKSDGGAISLKELATVLKINIPLKIVPNPENVPSLFFVDYFNKNNVFGIVLPTNSRDDALFLKMSDWETSMVNDLKPLWDGFSIDNEAGYFANSKLFTNARYALIDKKTGLTLDYVVTGGNVFITFGRYSMQALNKEFLGIQKASGIKWENSADSPAQAPETAGGSGNLNSNTNSVNANNNSASNSLDSLSAPKQ